jgi:hypothetical protein
VNVRITEHLDVPDARADFPGPITGQPDVPVAHTDSPSRITISRAVMDDTHPARTI